MANYQYTDFGPFVKAGTKKIQKPSVIKTCITLSCSNYHKDKYDLRDMAFCPRCGAQITPVQIFTESDEVRARDLVEELDEAMMTWEPDGYDPKSDDLSYHFWVANENREGVFGLEISRDTHDIPGYLDLSKLDIAAQIQNFKVQFHKELDIMRSKYETVEVLFGFLTYYN